MFEDTCWVQDSTVGDFSFVWLIAKEEMATGAAAGLSFIQVTGVAVDFENHIASGVLEDGVGQGGEVIQELVDGEIGSFGGFALLGRKRAECDEGSAIYCSSVIQECADNLLDSFFGWFIKEWGAVVRLSELDFCTILWCIVSVRGELWTDWVLVIELMKCAGDVSRH